MPLKAAAKPTLAQLGYIFQHQILPLLQEYFFEDWQRIAWVLNRPSQRAALRRCSHASQTRYQDPAW